MHLDHVNGGGEDGVTEGRGDMPISPLQTLKIDETSFRNRLPNRPVALFTAATGPRAGVKRENCARPASVAFAIFATFHNVAIVALSKGAPSLLPSRMPSGRGGRVPANGGRWG